MQKLEDIRSISTNEAIYIQFQQIQSTLEIQPFCADQRVISNKLAIETFEKGGVWEFLILYSNHLNIEHPNTGFI